MIGTVLAFIQTLPREQLSPEHLQTLRDIDFMQVDGGEQPTLAAPPLLRSDGAFFNPLHGMPTALEVRVLGVLLLFRFETTRADELTVEKWISGVDTEAERMSPS